MSTLTTGVGADFAVELAALRRRIHAHPEVGLDLPLTQRAVLDALDGLDLEITVGTRCTSVVAVLRGAARGPGGRRSVLLRGDMDALPVTERTGLAFASTDGTMHACGHDLHIAGLVGAARLLHARRAELPGDVVFMFQPGEEGFDGAAVMIDEGVLDAAGTRASAAYALHVLSSLLPSGVFATRGGPMMAASSGLVVTVRGRGGHASRPHAAADPVVAAAEMVTALQTVVTRQLDAFDPVVVTVGTFHAGTKRNIIPDTATFEATVRTFSPQALDRVRLATTRLCAQIAAAHGLTADVSFAEEYPVTVNAEAHADRALAVATELFGAARSVQLPHPAMGSEDFSRVLAEIPGAFVLLGACTQHDPLTAPSNHSADAGYDERVLPDAAALLAELAIRALTDPVPSS